MMYKTKPKYFHFFSEYKCQTNETVSISGFWVNYAKNRSALPKYKCLDTYTLRTVTLHQDAFSDF